MYSPVFSGRRMCLCTVLDHLKLPQNSAGRGLPVLGLKGTTAALQTLGHGSVIKGYQTSMRRGGSWTNLRLSLL